MAERAFLSSVLSDPDSIGEIDSLKVDAEDFLEFRNRTVFQHFLKLKKAGVTPDYITLAESLNSVGELERVGGQNFLVSIFDEYASSANLKSYAELIKKKSIFRDVVQKAKEIQSIAVSGEVSQEELLGKINKILIDLNDGSTNGNSLDFKDSIL